MTIPSFEQSQELSILVFEPLVSGTALVTDQLGNQLNSYSHTITALGGYESLSITINDRQLNVEDWLGNGIGRHIEAYNPSLVKIWEGFVNTITINLGGLSVVRGPLMEVSNNVAITYSTIDTSITPPAIGARVTSTFNTDSDSQSKYGELTAILSTGGIDGSEVSAIRDTFLNENKEPQTSQQITVGGGGEISMTLDCLGYYHFFKRYVYNQTASTGTANLSVILSAIIAADPNSIFSTSTTNITTNTLAVKQYTNDNTSAWKLIQGLIARGDTSDNRYIFQILNDRIPTYAAIPTSVEYQQRLSDPAQRVETTAGTEVKPWDIQAAKWLFVPDFLIGKTQPADLRLDARMIFIESVTYTMPWGLSIQGGNTDKLGQKLAKLGLGGIGAGT